MALNDVPQGPQRINATQAPIRQNFVNYIDAEYAIDHVAFGPGGTGFHNRITFPVQSPAPIFAGTQIGLYSFVDPDTTLPELYIRNSSAKLTPITSSLKAEIGWTWLPSGILMQWGKKITSGASVLPVTFPKVFPNGAFNVMATNSPGPSATAPGVTSLTATGFTINASTPPASYYWIAIGN